MMPKEIDLSQNHPYNSLSIQVSLDGFLFKVKNELSKEVVFEREKTFESAQNPEQLLISIKNVLDAEKSLQGDFNKVEVFYENDLYTFVPTALFDPKSLADYLKFNIKILETDFIAYDEITPHEFVLVYVPYTNLNNYFFERFGGFNYHHHLYPILKKVLDESLKKDNVLVKVQIHVSYFDLVIVAGKKLVLANTFHYQTPEDVLYHILFCYGQLDLDTDSIPLDLLKPIDEESPIYRLLHNYIRHVRQPKCLNVDTD